MAVNVKKQKFGSKHEVKKFGSKHEKNIDGNVQPNTRFGGKHGDDGLENGTPRCTFNETRADSIVVK